MALLDKLFGKSPFGPVIEHAKKVYECIELINPVIKAWLREDWDISRMGADGRLSVDAFVRTVHRRLQGGSVTILEFARWLCADYVMLQHQLVATGKLPDNTFRFRREGDRLRFFNLPNSLGFMNSRFDAISTTIHELGLIGDMGQPQHPLTINGQRLLAQGDLE